MQARPEQKMLAPPAGQKKILAKRKDQNVFYMLTVYIHVRINKKEGMGFIILDMNPNLWISGYEKKSCLYRIDDI
jgi:hypothetical protein